MPTILEDVLWGKQGRLSLKWWLFADLQYERCFNECSTERSVNGAALNALLWKE